MIVKNNGRPLKSYGGKDGAVMGINWSQFNENTIVLLSLFTILVSGFLLTRLTNVLRMPRVSGYIIAGVVIGPCVLHLIPEVIVSRMGFVSDIALAFIAFGVGRFFKKDVLMKTGKEVILITVSEALVAGLLVTLAMHYLFRLSWEFSLVLGAIATATAPASTMMTINQYKAKGEFVNTLLQVVALDDVVCLLAFSVVSAWVNGRESGQLSLTSVALPILWNVLAIFLGALCGFILSKLLTPQRSRDNRLILVIAMLCGLSGICAAFDISPLLSCMVLGAVYINLTKDKKLYRQINNFTPPVMSIFFIVSGMSLDLTTFKTLGMVGVAYFFIRIVGKYFGTYISCKVTGKSREICNYMGLALVPQAGVAIGLAFLGRRLLPEEAGTLVMTIILASSVLYELVGPICAKKALILAGTIPRERLAAEAALPLEKRLIFRHTGRGPASPEPVSVDGSSPVNRPSGRRRSAKGNGMAETGASGKRPDPGRKADGERKNTTGGKVAPDKKPGADKKTVPEKKTAKPTERKTTVRKTTERKTDSEKKTTTGKKASLGKKAADGKEAPKKKGADQPGRERLGQEKIIRAEQVETAREKKKTGETKRVEK